MFSLCLNWIVFSYKNWKFLYHIIIGTKRFGVDNKWWCSFDSIFGLDIYKQIINIITVKPLFLRYKMARFRSIDCGFLHPDNAIKLWPKNKKLIFLCKKDHTDEEKD